MSRATAQTRLAVGTLRATASASAWQQPGRHATVASQSAEVGETVNILEGQVTFEMANLRPKTTNLPFVVWVSQKAGGRHDVRVKVAQTAKVIPSQMGVYAVRPFAHIAGPRLSETDERLLEAWIAANADVLVGVWDGDIEYTEDLIERIKPL
jgi:hypothetical protein